MNMQELKELIYQGEKVDIECKKAEKSVPKSAYESYSAFANTKGGYIILGVREDKTKTNPKERFIIQGIEDAPKQKEDFWNTINGNKVNINLLTDDDVKIVEDGSISLIVIHVPRADFNMRPVYVGENPYKGTYKRNHEGDYHMSEYEVDALIRDKNPEGNDSVVLQGYTMEDIEEWLSDSCEKIKPFVCNTGAFLRNAQNEGKNILFEAQLGSLRDLDYGIYPYTTSSNTTAAYAPIGSGLPSAKIDEVVGVVKAYSTCVGEGPFVCEMFGNEAEDLRKAGFEYGAKTGRPRRVGPIDIVATRYGVQVQSATDIALTKLDVLSYMDKIPVCTHYTLNGEITDEFPFPSALNSAQPVIEYFEGWKCDISKIRNWNDLPKAARDYVCYIEKAVGCPIKYVSVGPERDSMIIKPKEN